MVSLGCVHTNPDIFETAFFSLESAHRNQFDLFVFLFCFVLFCFSFLSLLVGILPAFLIVYSTVPVYH